MQTAIQSRNEALQRVEDNNAEFCAKATAFAETWATKQMKPFTVDDLKADYYKAGFERPREPRAWSAPILALLRQKIIFAQDKSVASKDPICNARKKQQYISREFSIKQARNRGGVTYEQKQIASKLQLKLI